MAKKRKKKRRSRTGSSPAPGAARDADPPPPHEAPSDASMGAACADATNGPSRPAANAIIALFLLFALAMPASYYLTGGGHDERFAWRMFSSIRQYSCQVQLYETDREGRRAPTKLRGVLHVAWINMLKRGRPAVGDKALRARCAEDPSNASVELRRACTAPDGEVQPTSVHTLNCRTGEVSKRQVAGRAL